MKVELLNGTNLAYIGDAYYELYVRKYLLEQGITKANNLTKEKIKLVSAHAHSLIYPKIESLLNDKEKQIFQKGKNATTTSYRKNVYYKDYNISTGLEAVIGYLFLNEENERLSFLMEKIVHALAEE